MLQWNFHSDPGPGLLHRAADVEAEGSRTMHQPKLLSREQIACFRDNGYLSPVRVMSPEDAMRKRASLEAFEKSQGSPLKRGQSNKSYLLFRWAFETMTHPRLLDAVEDLIGPDFVCYHSTVWIKEAHSPGYVSWHQDSTYFGLEPLEQVTAWVALSPATLEAGCLHVQPRSHVLGQLGADLKPDARNLLTSGQTVRANVDASKTVPMPLQPGEMSLHHTCTIHGSAGNESCDRRIGLCLHYVPANVKPIKPLIYASALCSAFHVRGKAQHAYFPAEVEPKADNDEAAIAEHARAVASYRRMVQALGHHTATRLD